MLNKQRELTFPDSISQQEVDLENDIFLGETSLQIIGFNNSPSIHIIRSYKLKDSERQDCYYHVFNWKTGTSAINYRPKQYEQVAKHIDLSDLWTIFYTDDKKYLPLDMIDVPKEWRYE